MRIRDESGRELDASFSIQEEDGSLALYYESRGPNRNTEYAQGFELLIGRLAAQSALISDAFVASRETEHLSPDERRIEADGYPYPIDAATVGEVRRFRIAFGAAQGRVGRDPAATKGPGNPTKRVRLSLRWETSPQPSVEELGSMLQGQAADGVSYWAFCANPNLYRIEAAVRDLLVDHWTTKESRSR